MLPTYKILKKKEKITEDETYLSEYSPYRSSANYTLLRSNKKAESHTDISSLDETKEVILDILKKDREYWKSLGEPTQGVEKNNLLSKVCNKIPINGITFEMAIDELLSDQSIVPMELDDKIRFLKL